MAEYYVSDIMRDVRIAIDEDPVSAPLTAEDELDPDALEVDAIIRSKIEDGVRGVVSDVPVWMFDIVDLDDFSDSEIAWMERRVSAAYQTDHASAINASSGPGSKFSGHSVAGSIVLPEDFMRLVRFRMSDWERSVSAALTEDSEQYVMQRSRWAGVRGTPQNPVAAVVTHTPEAGDGLLCLEFYSCRDESATIADALYLPIPSIQTRTLTENNTSTTVEYINISTRLYRPAIYHIGHLALLALGQGDLAQALEAKMTELLE